MSEKISLPFADILSSRLSRRRLLEGALAITASSAIASCTGKAVSSAPQHTYGFNEVAHGLDPFLTLPEGYSYQVVARWGDPLFESAPSFNAKNQTAQAQSQQFGFNNDFVGFVPLSNANSTNEGLLVVNHEHTKARMMHAGVRNEADMNPSQMEVDIMAHGMSVIHIRRIDRQWKYLMDSPYTRRVTPYTPMKFSGPASGHDRLKTLSQPNGTTTLGTYGNCAGGVTPWGTVLSAEENVDNFFSGDIAALAEAENYQRFGFEDRGKKRWSEDFPRWDLNQNPQEGMHVGWVVEIDPEEPNSKPIKHTALGRFKHEGCTIHISRSGHAVAYSGDDQAFEYIYRFVSEDVYRPNNKAHNKTLLTKGTLSVAVFSDTGTLEWVPLVWGQGPLTPENGFASQADISLDTRKAADLVGATPMDRPEDIEVNPSNGHVYVMLTKNKSRTDNELNGPNSRAFNHGGQIIELRATDHTQPVFSWEVFILAGKPGELPTLYNPETQPGSWLATPDNCTFDKTGNIWVTSDGAEHFGVADGVWLMATEGPKRALPQRFLRAPIGAEVCGPCFSPDQTTLFCAIQHPGNDSNFDKPDTRWPDYSDELPPRPSLIAITRQDGKAFG